MGDAPLPGHPRRAERATRRAAGILLIAATCRPHRTVPPSPATVGGVAPITPAQVDTMPGARRPGRICTAERRAGIILDIQDSVTGAPLALRALVVAMHGTQVDSVRHLRAPTDVNEDADERRLRIWLAWEQAGMFDIAVHVHGYAIWRRTNVLVQAGPCHVMPTHLVARLVRA